MKRSSFVAVMILIAHVVFGVSSVATESATFDEAFHLASGVSYWRTGDFRMNPEHPPFLKLINALPAVLAGATLPTDHTSWNTWDGWAFGDQFLYTNRLTPEMLLWLGRIPTIILSLILGWLVFVTSRRLFGSMAGVLSVTLYALDPNVIAHSRYITTDLGFALAAFVSINRLITFLQRPSRRNGAILWLVLTLTILTKFTSLALVIILPVIYLALRRNTHLQPAVWSPRPLTLVVSLLGTMAAIWAVYGFDIRRPAEDPRIQRLYEQRQMLLESGNIDQRTAIEQLVIRRLGDRQDPFGAVAARVQQWPIPAYAFWRGALAVVGHSIGGQEAYLLGETNERGWWYYFPIAFAVKTPLITLIVITAGVVILWLSAVKTAHQTFREWWSQRHPTVVAYCLFVGLYFLIAITSNLNLGWRHILPVYPFLFVLAGSLFSRSHISRWQPVLLALVMVSLAVLHLRIWPNYTGYFSELIGGPSAGYRILADSNVDWGQDLRKLAAYIRQRQIEEPPFAYYGRQRAVAYYLPQARKLATAEEVNRLGVPTGLVTISFGELIRSDRAYAWLFQFEPSLILGSSIFLYDLDDQ